QGLAVLPDERLAQQAADAADVGPQLGVVARGGEREQVVVDRTRSRGGGRSDQQVVGHGRHSSRGLRGGSGATVHRASTTGGTDSRAPRGGGEDRHDGCCSAAHTGASPRPGPEGPGALMKIAMVGTRGVPARYGGFETCVEEVGSRLVERGHEVVVYCRTPLS